jgi:hypothetical protein
MYYFQFIPRGFLWVLVFREVAQYATRREVPVSIAGNVLGNFQVTYSFCPHSVVLWSAQPLTEMCSLPRNFLGGKMRPARRADNCTVLVVPNVKVRTEAQHFVPPLSLHDLLRESFTFTSLYLNSVNVQFRNKRRGFCAVLIALRSGNVAVV